MKAKIDTTGLVEIAEASPADYACEVCKRLGIDCTKPENKKKWDVHYATGLLYKKHAQNRDAFFRIIDTILP